MARQRRTNHAKAKLWLKNMTADIEGTISGVSLMAFQSIGLPAERHEVLQMMQEWHGAMIEKDLAEAPTEAPIA